MSDDLYHCRLLQNAQLGTVKGRKKITEVTAFGDPTWKKNRLVKIVSGSDHSLALTENGHVFSWGDSTTGKTGRVVCKDRTGDPDRFF